MFTHLGCLLGCEALLSGGNVSTFQRKLLSTGGSFLQHRYSVTSLHVVAEEKQPSKDKGCPIICRHNQWVYLLSWSTVRAISYLYGT